MSIDLIGVFAAVFQKYKCSNLVFKVMRYQNRCSQRCLNFIGNNEVCQSVKINYLQIKCENHRLL